MKTHVILFCLCCTVAAVQSEPPKAELLKPGSDAPTFSLPSLAGKRQALRVWCGENLKKPYINDTKHTVILSFWATWCKPCMKEIPQLISFMESHQTEPIKLFCVSIDEGGASEVRPFVEKKGWEIEVLLDPYRRTAERYGLIPPGTRLISVPALFVIGPEGKVRYSAGGFADTTDLAAKLNGVLERIAKGEEAVVGEVEVAGETVSAESAEPSAEPDNEMPPKTRWQAIVKWKCGQDIAAVADQLGVAPEDIEGWYKELKEAAMATWGSAE